MGALTRIFSSPKEPAPPPVAPIGPVEDAALGEKKKAKRKMAASGRRRTVLTSPLGLSQDQSLTTQL